MLAPSDEHAIHHVHELVGNSLIHVDGNEQWGFDALWRTPPGEADAARDTLLGKFGTTPKRKMNGSIAAVERRAWPQPHTRFVGQVKPSGQSSTQPGQSARPSSFR